MLLDSDVGEIRRGLRANLPAGPGQNLCHARTGISSEVGLRRKHPAAGTLGLGADEGPILSHRDILESRARRLRCVALHRRARTEVRRVERPHAAAASELAGRLVQDTGPGRRSLLPGPQSDLRRSNRHVACTVERNLLESLQLRPVLAMRLLAGSGTRHDALLTTHGFIWHDIVPGYIEIAPNAESCTGFLIGKDGFRWRQGLTHADFQEQDRRRSHRIHGGSCASCPRVHAC